MRKIICTVVVILLGVLLYLKIHFGTFIPIVIQGGYNVHFCNFAIGSSWFNGFVSNKELCYTERAYELHDVYACFKLQHVGSCVASVSEDVGIYYCDKISNNKQREDCSETLMMDWSRTDSFHHLKGLEKHRINKELVLYDGDIFLQNQVNINERGIEFFSQSRHTCLGKQQPHLKINTIGGGPNYIYITDCEVNGNAGVLTYFKYDFNFLEYPSEI